MLNALLNLKGFRGTTLCSLVVSLLPCQQLNVETPCCWSLQVGHPLLIFCKLQKVFICTMAMIPNQVGVILRTLSFSGFEKSGSGLCGKTCELDIGTVRPVTFL